MIYSTFLQENYTAALLSYYIMIYAIRVLGSKQTFMGKYIIQHALVELPTFTTIFVNRHQYPSGAIKRNRRNNGL